jgi:hypothetical protein
MEDRREETFRRKQIQEGDGQNLKHIVTPF